VVGLRDTCRQWQCLALWQRTATIDTALSQPTTDSKQVQAATKKQANKGGIFFPITAAQVCLMGP